MASVPFAGAKVVINPTAVASFMRGPEGPLLRKMILIGEAVKVATIASLSSGFPREFLGPVIVKRIVMTSEGPTVLVGAVRTKTQPHQITGNPLLVFYWPKAGRVVAFPRVNHPGSEFAPYVAKKLLEALAAVRGTF